MIVVQLQKSEAYQPLYDLSGYSVNDSLIITNDTPQTIFLTRSDAISSSPVTRVFGCYWEERA